MTGADADDNWKKNTEENEETEETKDTKDYVTLTVGKKSFLWRKEVDG